MEDDIQSVGVNIRVEHLQKTRLVEFVEYSKRPLKLLRTSGILVLTPATNAVQQQ